MCVQVCTSGPVVLYLCAIMEAKCAVFYVSHYFDIT